MPHPSWNESYASGQLPWDTGQPEPLLVDFVNSGGVSPCLTLEIGAGTGTNAIWLAERGFNVLGLDVAPLAIERAQAKTKGRKLDCRFAVWDILAAPPPGGPFQFVFDRGCFHVFDEAEQFAAQVAAVLEPGGLWLSLIGSTEGPPREVGPPRRSACEVTHAIEPELEIIELRSTDFRDANAKAWFCVSRRRTTPALASFGLRAAEASMGQFGERRVLIVERFDRLWAEDGRLLRVPQEDCCQALSISPTLKYESDGGPGIERILRLLRDGDNPAEDQRSLMKAMVLFWLLGATDGHSKNFSIFLSPGGRYRMTPLYDVISAQPSIIAGEIRPNQFRLEMAVGNTRHYRINTITARHFVETAQRAGMGERIMASTFEESRQTATKAVRNTVSQLPKNFPEEIATAIQLGINKRLQTIPAT